MGMIGTKVSALRDHLFKLDDREPLSKLSLAVIIALDIFILIVLFNGLSEHTEQLTAPYEYVPYECRAVYIDNDWTETSRLDKLQPLVLSGYENISYRNEGYLERADTQIMHPTCAALYRTIKAIADNDELKSLFVKRQLLETQRRDIVLELSKNRSTYNTSLLEDIAKKRTDDEPLDDISSRSKGLSDAQNTVEREIASIDSTLNAAPLIASLWQTISQDTKTREALIADYKRYQYWYAVKKLLWQMLFILPIFFAFYFWSSHSVRKQHSIQTLIATHLLVVSAIPIVLKVIELLLDLIPHHFFKKLFELLEKMHLIAIWHYFIIIATVAASLLLIYLVQKKLFNQHRTYQRRLTKGECYACGLKLPPNADYCPFCGESQLKSCSTCHGTTPAQADFCIRCGSKQSNHGN